MIIIPTKYTKYEGGPWHKWNNGSIQLPKINSELRWWDIKKKSIFIYLKNRKVHSLIFKAAEFDYPQRWDCISGVTGFPLRKKPFGFLIGKSISYIKRLL